MGVNAGPCTSATVDTGCTDIVGLPPAALAGVVNLASVAGCGIGKTSCVTITGGAEGGHLDHGPGQPVVDIAENNTLTSYITAHGGTPVQTKLGPQYTETVNGQSATFLHESNPPHWHVTFN